MEKINFPDIVGWNISDVEPYQCWNSDLFWIDLDRTWPKN